MKVTFVDGSADPLFSISNAMRVCTNTQDKNETKTREAFVRAHLKKEENLLEHAFVQLQIDGISRACATQITRHRDNGVYAQESQRYVDYSKAKFIIPPSIKGTDQEGKYVLACESAVKTYTDLVASGVKKEDARFVLPEAMETRLMMSGNLRWVRHFVRMRNTPQAQWEIRAVAQEIAKVVTERYGTDFFAEGL